MVIHRFAAGNRTTVCGQVMRVGRSAVHTADELGKRIAAHRYATPVPCKKCWPNAARKNPGLPKGWNVYLAGKDRVEATKDEGYGPTLKAYRNRGDQWMGKPDYRKLPPKAVMIAGNTLLAEAGYAAADAARKNGVERRVCEACGKVKKMHAGRKWCTACRVSIQQHQFTTEDWAKGGPNAPRKNSRRTLKIKAKRLHARATKAGTAVWKGGDLGGSKWSARQRTRDTLEQQWEKALRRTGGSRSEGTSGAAALAKWEREQARIARGGKFARRRR